MPARKPTRLLEISGAFKKDPQRRRNHEPIPSGPLGDPPGFLPEPVKACWRELNAMIPPGVLAVSDRWAVELAARAMANARDGSITNAERAVLSSLLGRMGLTPVDRARIAAPPPVLSGSIKEFLKRNA
jgi:hypothetical protein